MAEEDRLRGRGRASKTPKPRAAGSGATAAVRDFAGSPAAAETAGADGHSFGALETPAEPRPSAVTQLFAVPVLAAQHDLVKAATGNGKDVLDRNREAQEALDAARTDPPRLTPYFTTMGFEVEFAQQPPLHEDVFPTNALSKAHILVAEAPGFTLKQEPGFKLETDAAAALEFVTAPLLAPLQMADPAPDVEEEEPQRVVPIPAWENLARKALEFDLRGIASGGTGTVEEIIAAIRVHLGIDLGEASPDKKDITYGDINKFAPNSYTNAQLNFMTTLENYARINVGGDSPTQELFGVYLNYYYTDEYGPVADARRALQDAKEVLKSKPKDAGLKAAKGEAEAALRESEAAFEEQRDASLEKAEAYIYALCQKIREIPSILVDQTLSVLLDADSKSETKGEQERLVEVTRGDASARRTLASHASHIKDEATLWLKASFSQILATVPEEIQLDVVYGVRGVAEQAMGILMRCGEVTEALEPFYEPGAIAKFLEERLEQVHVVLNQAEDGAAASDYETTKRVGEQRVVDEEARKAVIGARPDTYVRSDQELADEALFLVETRRTTSYLGLTAEDRYGV